MLKDVFDNLSLWVPGWTAYYGYVWEMLIFLAGVALHFSPRFRSVFANDDIGKAVGKFMALGGLSVLLVDLLNDRKSEIDFGLLAAKVEDRVFIEGDLKWEQKNGAYFASIPVRVVTASNFKTLRFVAQSPVVSISPKFSGFAFILPKDQPLIGGIYSDASPASDLIALIVELEEKTQPYQELELSWCFHEEFKRCQKEGPQRLSR